jgi:hypothetical protein
MLKNEKHSELLEKYGFVKFPILSKREVNELMGELCQICLVELELKNVAHAYNSANDQNLEKKRRIESLIRSVFRSKVNEVFDSYKLFNSFAVIKQPGGGYVVPHQHPPSVEDFSIRTYVMWCSLVDIDAQNGRMQFVDGSQNIIPGVIPYAYNSPFNKFHDRLEQLSTPVETKAGECIVFDENILHWSEVNKTETPRIAVASTCIPNSLSPVFYHLDKDRNNFFEVLRIDDSFSLNTTFSGQPIERPSQYPSIGFTPNKVMDLSEERFVEIQNKREKLIPEIKILDKIPVVGSRMKVFERIRNLFS